MSHLKIPEISFTPDSDDTYEDNWFSSPTTSFDGSSVNSIPWSEDVIKQNQEEWERIEKIFYGEENLPKNDEKLRNEIIEWTNRFPHLRIIGEQAPIYFDSNAVPSDPLYEEIFEQHPSSYQKSKSARPHNSSYRSAELISPVGHTRRAGNDFNASLNRDIEKYLRITSGPLLNRRPRISNTSNDAKNSHIRKVSNETALYNTNSRAEARPLNNNKAQSSSSSFDESSQKNSLLDTCDIKGEPITFSARLIKMPSIKSEHEYLHISDSLRNKWNCSDNIIRIKTATLIPVKRPLKNSITLPAINLVPVYKALPSNSGRSISALINHRYDVENSSLSQRNYVKRRSDSE